MALYTGSPVVLSQTSAVSRWLVIPTAAMSETLRSALARAPAVTSRVLSQISFALCSTHPARGKICSCSFWSTFTTRPSRLKIMHRVDVVPWSMAAMYCSLMRFLLDPTSSLTSGVRVSRRRGGLDGVDQGLGADGLEQQRCDDRADDRPDDGHPGVAPVRAALAPDRQDRVRDPGREVTGGVDGVAGRAAEGVADPDDQQRDEQRTELGRRAPRHQDDEDQHEGADRLRGQVPGGVADGRCCREHRELGARVLLDVEVLFEGDPGEHGADEGAEELAEEVEDRLDEGDVAQDEVGDRHGGVEVGAGREGHVDTGEDAEAPAEVDEQPAAAEALAVTQDRRGDDPAAQQQQHGRAERLVEEDLAVGGRGHVDLRAGVEPRINGWCGARERAGERRAEPV